MVVAALTRDEVKVCGRTGLDGEVWNTRGLGTMTVFFFCAGLREFERYWFLLQKRCGDAYGEGEDDDSGILPVWVNCTSMLGVAGVCHHQG